MAGGLKPGVEKTVLMVPLDLLLSTGLEHYPAEGASLGSSCYQECVISGHNLFLIGSLSSLRWDPKVRKGGHFGVKLREAGGICGNELTD